MPHVCNSNVRRAHTVVVKDDHSRLSVYSSVFQAGQKQLRWPAHEGVVTAVDWNMVNDLLVSGGEDSSYRVRKRRGEK